MNYSTFIDNRKMIEWGLLYPEAALFDWFCTLHYWADTISFEGHVFYFASRNKALEENPVIAQKPDTMYRYYKKLEDKGLIVLIKVSNKDYIRLTAKAKTWGRFVRHSEMNPNQLGNESENNLFNSEMNPNQLGNESENNLFNSEMNPNQLGNESDILNIKDNNNINLDKDKRDKVRKRTPVFDFEQEDLKNKKTAGEKMDLAREHYKSKEIVLPWESNQFVYHWLLYRYFRRKEHGFKFKTEISEQAAINKLIKISGGDEKTACNIILQSIENNWKGLFTIKDNGNSGNKTANGSTIGTGASKISSDYLQRIRDEIAGKSVAG